VVRNWSGYTCHINYKTDSTKHTWGVSNYQGSLNLTEANNK